MSLDFWMCDRGHKHATEAHAIECNRRARLGQMMPPDDEIAVEPAGEQPSVAAGGEQVGAIRDPAGSADDEEYEWVYEDEDVEGGEEKAEKPVKKPVKKKIAKKK
jgi:hypothetical protein